ncbi:MULTISPECIES: LysE family translocator [unclassified Agarivorans]|uniref:LysE family translocator n=1 Tax=unclassified Agarivorans TaxID=2636026 RepID=UPI0026E29E66|nr:MULTISPECIES: homoserine/threonine efflux transporter [unclassified Agarivorans]MDO6684016.1 homoserine/threonine efflux transporter [Agarivorans sp. 3_MG-2023]MDO6714251.1 homoserine/threonine efflux transporter [Agarivorans sp. 2_MG-2023]
MYWTEFLTVVLVHLLAVASPGPDLAVVLKNSISLGRRAAIFTSIGVGCGIMVHVVYSVLGIGLIISQSIWLFNVIKWLGAAYLIWIGIQGLRAKRRNDQDIEAEQGLSTSDGSAFLSGFMTNGLNPKATLFFLSLFTVVINPSTPMLVQLGYGLYMVFATALWFIMISWVFSSARVRRKFLQVGHWFDRTMGLVLVGLGIRLLFSSRNQ